ncbi:putative neuroblastoma breakpoint family member 5 [Cavia porcellus]|uniref:putative neuroblastoma breakpoint family member 5 n=1 Tax=Cavia porcellus TaxID=10141 RepID=UPI002FE0ADC1
MAAGSLCAPRVGMSTLESNQGSCCQREGSKPQFEDLKEGFLPLESPAYILTKLLQKYKSLNSDFPEPLLRKKQQSEKEQQASLAEKLREARILIQDQKRKLFLLRQKLHHGREVSFPLSELLRDLLKFDDSDSDQGQGLRDELVEAHRLAEHLLYKLSPDKGERALGEDDLVESLALRENQQNLQSRDTEVSKRQGHGEKQAKESKPPENLSHDLQSGEGINYLCYHEFL